MQAWVKLDDGRKVEAPARLKASSRPVRIQRLTDRRPSLMEQRLQAARYPEIPNTLASPEWTIDEIPGPNITDKETVLNLAKMAANAYIMEPETERWVDVSRPWNHSQKFGWEADGLRGHIYADKGNSTIVVALKGTSTALFDGEETTRNDKVNDNLFFSCCCGQGGQYFWRQVCDCYSSTYTCNATCLVSSLRAENRYYRAALDLYANVTELYPNSNVWLSGHSLGGAVTSLLGLTYGHPVVTFEAVPEALPASRLGLPIPPGSDSNAPQKRDFSGAYHFGHTADPVYMGTCNGATSICTLGGYAMESSCHTGQRCVYDTVEDFGWRVGIGTHRILSVVTDVIEKYDDVPVCAPDKDCVDCFNWKFFESNGSDSTTTSPTSTTSSLTRTSTCQTPGWWGCLDETTTTETQTTGFSTTEPATTEPATTTTCETPGWFWCKDETTTTPTPTPSATATPAPIITTTTAVPTPTSTCETPGWFGGCNDPTSLPTATETSHSTTPQSSATCQKPGFFWGCWDTIEDYSTITPAPT